MTTTTNPSLAIDNDERDRWRAMEEAEEGLHRLANTYNEQRASLEAENARLRAALTESERARDGNHGTSLELLKQLADVEAALAECETDRDEHKQWVDAVSTALDMYYEYDGPHVAAPAEDTVRAVRDLREKANRTIDAEAARRESERARAEALLALEVSLNTTAETLERAQRAEFDLSEEKRARAILAKQLDQEVARLPRLRQEQTAEIERLKARAVHIRDALGLGEAGNEVAAIQAQTARIAELEAEVARLNANYRVPALRIDKDDEAVVDALVKRSREPAPAAPALSDVETFLAVAPRVLMRVQMLKGENTGDVAALQDAIDIVAQMAPPLERVKLPPAPAAPNPEPAGEVKPACSICDDTHQMPLRDGYVLCTRCPRPCRKCADGDGRGAYCAATPCPCDCHRRPTGEVKP